MTMALNLNAETIMILGADFSENALFVTVKYREIEIVGERKLWRMRERRMTYEKAKKLINKIYDLRSAQLEGKN
jgi:hypothetical protein